MSVTSRQAVDFGVTYWSRDVGPYIWHEYDVARTIAELRAIQSAGHRTVRTHLLWDAFMPTPAASSRRGCATSIASSRRRPMSRFR